MFYSGQGAGGGWGYQSYEDIMRHGTLLPLIFKYY